MARRQRDDQFPTGVNECTGADEQRAGTTLDERCKGALDLAVAADVEDLDLLPNGRSRSSDV